MFSRLPSAHLRPATPASALLNAAARRRRLPSPFARRFASARQPSAPPASRPVQSGLGYTLTVAALGIAAGSLFVAFPGPADVKARTAASSLGPEPQHAHESLEPLGMPSELPPGRPGNLTPEQEAKLRELWAALQKLMGRRPDSPTTTPEPASNGAETPASAATADTSSDGGSTKRRSRRLHLFKRKHHDKDGAADSAPVSPTSPMPPGVAGVDVSGISLEDDKHGAGKAFRAALADLTPEELHAAIWSMVKHDNPDGLLLRFLRARKWDVQAALVMLVSTMHWRAVDMHVDDGVVRVGELGAVEHTKSEDPTLKKEGEDFMAQLRMGKSFLHGVDKEGRPMCFVRVRLHRQGEQSEPSLERFTVHTIETARMMLRPPVDTATVVFDMTGFSMANMDYTPVKFMIKCFEANYPESLGAVLVHKAPWVFQGIWTIIRGWLDPVVAGKVHFTKNVDELAEFVPRSHIPTDLGGDESWSYSYVEPAPAENAAMADTAARDALLASRDELVRKYEEATVEWMHGADDDNVKKERSSLADQLRANYWKLDPYVRARTLYDRTGVLGKEGALNFYPKREDVAAMDEKAAASPPELTSADDVD